MKNKVFFVLALMCAVVLTSCNFQEKKLTKEWVKGHQTFSMTKVEFKSIEVTKVSAHSVYDTVYHVSQIYTHKDGKWNHVDSVLVDSIRVIRIDYPTYKKCMVTYDERGMWGPFEHVDSVYVCQGVAHDKLDLYDTYHAQAEIVEQRPYNLLIPSIFIANFRLGSWARPQSLFGGGAEKWKI